MTLSIQQISDALRTCDAAPRGHAEVDLHTIIMEQSGKRRRIAMATSSATARVIALAFDPLLGLASVLHELLCARRELSRLGSDFHAACETGRRSDRLLDAANETIASLRQTCASKHDHMAKQGEEIAQLRAEVAQLKERQQAHLELIAKITHETPFAHEFEDWRSQRAKLIAEVGTLRASLEGKGTSHG